MKEKTSGIIYLENELITFAIFIYFMCCKKYIYIILKKKISLSTVIKCVFEINNS